MVQPIQQSGRVLGLSLAVLCTGQMMIVVDQNIVNVALPTVQESLGFSPANLVWVVNAYVIPFGGLLMPAGRLGDLIGRKIIFIAGIALFSAASLLCGFATSETTLIAFRFIQGVGGAVASACILGMVVTMFPEPRQQAQAVAAYSFASAGGGALGPLLGGVLTDLVSWHWIFFINAPIGTLVVLSARHTLRHDTGIGIGIDKGIDFLGAALVTTGLMLFVYTTVNAEQAGWGATETLVLCPLSAVLLVGFFVREATYSQPLPPLRIFRTRNLAAANVLQFLVVAGMFGLMYFGTLYLQRVLRYTSLEAGLGFMPIAVIIAAISIGLSARIIMKFGPRTICLAGLVLILLAFVGLSLARENGTYVVDFLPATALMGIGVGLALPAIMGLGMSSAAPSDSGVASGLFNTSQQLGGAIGLTVLTAFVSARTNSRAASGSSEISSILAGYHLGFQIAAIFTFLAVLVGAFSLRPTDAAHQEVPDEPQSRLAIPRHP